MEGRKLTLEEIQKRELAMLEIFDEFCKKYKLRYYLCGGTLLGAVRHKGFIPWDDDVDILMPRPDYQKMQMIARRQPLMPKYKFMSNRLGNLYYAFTKLGDMNTHVEKEFTEDEFDRYLWIDIFPMDGLPDSDEIINHIYKEEKRLNRILMSLKAKPGKGGNLAKKIVKPIIKPAMNAAFGKMRTANKIEKLALTYDFDRSKYAGGITNGQGPQEKMPKEEFLKAVPVEFCGKEFPAPSNYDFYLTAMFGDYMELPPEDKRNPHFVDTYLLESDDITQL